MLHILKKYTLSKGILNNILFSADFKPHIILDRRYPSGTPCTFLNCPLCKRKELYHEAVYKLNEDYTIAMEFDSEIFLHVGTNEFQWNGKSLIYEVIEIESIFYGLCQAIRPKNVRLEPGDRYWISIVNNKTEKGCWIFLLGMIVKDVKFTT